MLCIRMHMKASLRGRRLMACIADPSRFALLRSLEHGPACVTELAKRVGLSQSCTTRHLQALSRENLVKGVRDGKKVVFAIRDDDPVASRLREIALAGTEAEDATWAHHARPRRGGPARRPARHGRPRSAEPAETEPAEHDTHAARDGTLLETPAVDAPVRDPQWRPPSRSDIEDYLL